MFCSVYGACGYTLRGWGGVAPAAWPTLAGGKDTGASSVTL